MAETVQVNGRTEPRCTFVATDGRRCVMHQWHKAPRKRRGHYVTYGDVGDGHLLAGEQYCKWGGRQS